MPKAFTDCVSSGGRVRTISGPSKQHGLQAGQFRRICFPKGGGHPVLGEIKRNKKSEAVEK
jgi:hypothetical protein